MTYLSLYLQVVGASILLVAGVMLAARRHPFTPLAQQVWLRLVPTVLFIIVLLISFGLFLNSIDTKLAAVARRAGRPVPAPDSTIVWMCLLFVVGAAAYFLMQAVLLVRQRRGASHTSESRTSA
jgi:hypothetical protein